VTFLDSRSAIRYGDVVVVFILAFADAFYVYLFRFAELAAVVALRDWPAFLFNFEKGAICVSACGGPVAFDAGLTVYRR
jgi:hypothetical protein